MEKVIPFNGDTIIFETIKKLIAKYNIKNFIETGTYLGQTTGAMAQVVENVYSCEINVNYFEQAKENLKSFSNITLFNTSSKQFLENVLPVIQQPALFFLDAHWQEHNPLVDELKVIAENKFCNSIITIHDFQVPEKDFGFDYADSRKHQPLNWYYIKNYIDIIYHDSYKHYYNEQAEGSKRGIIYIEPNKINYENI